MRLSKNRYILVFIFIELVNSVEYNQPCTFSYGTCHWSVGRRWHVISLNVDDQILIADGESVEDRRNGFTDAIMSTWLHLSAMCSFDVRLTFQFSIQNVHDLMDIYLVHENRTRMSSLGQWKGIADERVNASEDLEPIWQQANVTFKAAEKFRIDIEVRHVPDNRTHSLAWFAVDDILIENCPFAMLNSKSRTRRITETTIISSTTTPLPSNEINSTVVNTSSWRFDDQSISPRQTLVTLILYLLCTLIALTLLIILLSIIIFTYRKHCCMRHPRRRPDETSAQNRIGIQIESMANEHRPSKTLDTAVRPCF